MELLAGRLFGGVMALLGYNLVRRPFSLPSKIEVLDAVDKIQSIVGISQSGAAWTLEKNWRLIIEIFEHLRSPIPKSLEADKEHLLKNEWNKRDSA